jgi:hypothetical protein
MAMPRRIRIEFGEAFPLGAFAVSAVDKSRDFDRSTKDNAVQAVDEELGLPLWQVDVHDGDPEVRKADREFTVRIAAKVQPVLPDAPFPGVPFIPIELDGLTATPYVAETGNGRSRLAWSFRASGVRAPKHMPAPAAGSGPGKGA